MVDNIEIILIFLVICEELREARGELQDLPRPLSRVLIFALLRLAPVLLYATEATRLAAHV